MKLLFTFLDIGLEANAGIRPKYQLRMLNALSLYMLLTNFFWGYLFLFEYQISVGATAWIFAFLYLLPLLFNYFGKTLWAKNSYLLLSFLGTFLYQQLWRELESKTLYLGLLILVVFLYDKDSEKKYCFTFLLAGVIGFFISDFWTLQFFTSFELEAQLIRSMYYLNWLSVLTFSILITMLMMYAWQTSERFLGKAIEESQQKNEELQQQDEELRQNQEELQTLNSELLRQQALLEQRVEERTQQLKNQELILIRQLGILEKSRNQLNASKERLFKILDHIPFGIWVVRPDLYFLYCNKTALTTFELDLGEVAEQRVTNILERRKVRFPSQTAHQWQDFPLQKALQGREGNQTSSLLFQVGRSDLPIEMTVAPIRDSETGEVEYAIAVLQDISERRGAEEVIKQAFEDLKVSERALRQTATQLQAALDRETESGKALSKTLSELKEAQSQLIQSEKMASIGQITAGIAHEINNPINFVKGGILALQTHLDELLELIDQELRKQFEQPNAAEAAITAEKARNDSHKKVESHLKLYGQEISQLLADINTGASRTAEIVRALRNFSHVENEEQMHLADLAECLDTALLLLKAETKDIDILFQEEEMPTLYCFSGQIQQVLMNILTNASQSIKEAQKQNIIEKGVIQIRTEKKADCVYIYLTDNGLGMSEETQKRIFEPFYTTKPVGEGTGLGMAISYNIIRKHRGRILVESAVGKGATFILELPLFLKED
ncbi:ATP-binding protein [Hugenholtzia roseola]|uniref:ATP-binding protein n=1 Tax=Hugenholtzia roseola TaxID=1002 RepID=UPI0003F6B38D|nr:ATP-binding protein [Hugenholtzia roseola]